MYIGFCWHDHCHRQRDIARKSSVTPGDLSLLFVGNKNCSGLIWKPSVFSLNYFLALILAYPLPFAQDSGQHHPPPDCLVMMSHTHCSQRSQNYVPNIICKLDFYRSQ